MQRTGLHSITVVLLLTFLVSSVHGQGDFWTPSDTLNKKRLRNVVIGEVGTYGITMVGLNQLWYADFERSGFRFFDDSGQWLQMDKAGHALTAYHLGLVGTDLMRWTGMSDKKAIWYGGTLGLTFLTTVEVFDAFSEEWGFSVADAASNVAGTALFIGQELAWGEQRFSLKFSYSPSDFADERPSVLGESWNERIIKDYNGQTIWLSTNVHAFLSESSKFPKWLNVAVGYGGDGMLGGRGNQFEGAELRQILQPRYRQYYLSLDIDLTRVKTRWAWLNTTLRTFSFIKVPLPTLEYNTEDGVQFRALHF